MSEGEGGLEPQVFLHDVQVRMADTRSTDLDEDLSWARGWLRNVLNLSRSTNTSKPYRSHDLTSLGLSKLPKLTLSSAR